MVGKERCFRSGIGREIGSAEVAEDGRDGYQGAAGGVRKYWREEKRARVVVGKDVRIEGPEETFSEFVSGKNQKKVKGYFEISSGVRTKTGLLCITAALLKRIVGRPSCIKLGFGLSHWHIEQIPYLLLHLPPYPLYSSCIANITLPIAHSFDGRLFSNLVHIQNRHTRSPQSIDLRQTPAQAFRPARNHNHLLLPIYLSRLAISYALIDRA